MSATAENTQAPAATLMRSIIQRIATGPELSKDIAFEEARDGMRLVLDGAVDPVQAAIFLIALRMKRETDDENRGVLEAILQATTTVTAEVDELMDIADPYDGYNRSLPVAPFLPALLAACGLPAVSHGVDTMGPKYGLTHRQVLKAAGVKVDLSPGAAARRVAQADAGWAYVDQSVYCPKLYALKALRTLIVKRPAITTVEVLAGPVRARGRTHVVTGFVHKPYPRIYALLARHAGFDSALIVRGVEGGVVPSLRQRGKYFYYHERGEEREREITPADFGFDEPLRPVAPPEHAAEASEGDDGVATTLDVRAMAKHAAELGLAALGNEPGAMRDNLIAAAAVCLHHVGRHESLQKAADAARAALASGAALARFKA